MRRFRSLALCGLLLPLLVLEPAWGRRESDPSSQPYDCGTMSLYHLLHLEGCPTDLETIARHLPHPGDEQRFSMKDLRDAARACGLRLTGVQLPKSDQAPNRTALVYVDQKPHGHFLIVRPVGHTGRLVQVIDSTRIPYVVDAPNLYASPEWTGLALIPSRPNWPVRIFASGTVIVGLVFVLRGVFQSRRSRSRESVKAMP